MTLHDKYIIQQLNERILNQSVVIQTLVDILIESNVISEKELDDRLQKNSELLNIQINKTHKELNDNLDDETEYDLSYYHGPIGEA